MAIPSDSYVKTALQVTGHFEDSSDPLGGVSGDFDGMGISLGVLQWNIGSGSLQPLVIAADRVSVLNAMPLHGDELWKACNANISQGLAIVRSWQNGHQLRKPILAELKAFTHSQAFVDQQIQKAKVVAEHAWYATLDWNTEAGTGQPTLHEFCWFFDIMTQNGGLKGISFIDVNNFIKQAGVDKADDLVCDWLESHPYTISGFKDAAKNANLWRDAVPKNSLTLFIASYLRAQKSKSEWRVDVLNRKATIATKQGWVHGEKQDLTKLI